jgi:hypothetical protein
MSHHYSGPNLGFPRGDARLDFTDLFAFPRPGQPGKSILIMDVHPSFDVLKSGPTTDEPFAPEGLYEIKIDTDGDAVANITYQIHFSSSEGGPQTATLRRLEGVQAAGTGESGQIVQGAQVSMGREAKVTQSGDYRFFAGWRSDPFFFDAGAFNNFQFVGQDFFGDKDICSMVLEVPNSALGMKKMALWARTLVRADGAGGSWVQADRGARPSQVPFLTGEQNEAYRTGQPADDDRFIDSFAHALGHFGKFTPEEARRAAGTLLPDLMYYDPMRPVLAPDNGRNLKDDVADTFLNIITNGKIQGDGMGPHSDFLAEFPYLGPPHKQDRQWQPLRVRAAGAVH